MPGVQEKVQGRSSGWGGDDQVCVVSRFNLPRRLCEAIPVVADHDLTILMHNDAVVQG